MGARLLGLLVLVAAGRGFGAEVAVSTSDQLGAAVSAAMAGDTILLEDGTYDSTGFSCSAAGSAAAPIVVKARHRRAAIVRFDALEGFKVGGDHWHFEGLDVRGVCAVDDDCEHAFHVGGASGFVLRDSVVRDFNAQLKVNAVQSGAGWRLPNGGLIEDNELFDSRARVTGNPTTKLNLDSGDDWIVRGNFLHDFQKGGGDHVSYGLFLKCGGQRGIVERNLVVCARDFVGGDRVGLSLGGGGCAPQYCQPSFDANVDCVEHHDGIVRNNIVASCSDVGVYINASAGSQVLYNTVIGTAGIDFRYAATTGEARGNVLTGVLRNRDGSAGVFANNVESVAVSEFMTWYTAPLIGELTIKGDLSTLIGKGVAVTQVADDYCGRARSAPYDVGALQHSLGDCDSTATPSGDLGATLPPVADLANPNLDVVETGCGGCSAGGAPEGPLLLVALVAPWLSARRRRRSPRGPRPASP